MIHFFLNSCIRNFDTSLREKTLTLWTNYFHNRLYDIELNSKMHMSPNKYPCDLIKLPVVTVSSHKKSFEAEVNASLSVNLHPQIATLTGLLKYSLLSSRLIFSIPVINPKWSQIDWAWQNSFQNPWNMTRHRSRPIYIWIGINCELRNACSVRWERAPNDAIGRIKAPTEVLGSGSQL